MVHTKLGLEVCDASDELDFILEALDGMDNLDFEYVRASRGFPKYTWKMPEKIVGDYLSKVAEEVARRFPEELRARIPVDIVVTVPAVCHCIVLHVKASKFYI